MPSTHLIFEIIQSKINRKYVVFHDFEISCVFFFFPRCFFVWLFFFLEKFTPHSLTRFQMPEKKQHFHSLTRFLPKSGQKNKLFRRIKKQRSAPGPLGDFVNSSLLIFLYIFFFFLSLHFLFITSFF